MNQGHTSRVDATPLTSRAVNLRNTCLGALARSASHPLPGDADVATLPSDITLREAWTWWSMRNSPPWTEAMAAAGKPIRKRRTLLNAAVTLLATAALLLFRAAPLGG